ncbi:MAG: formate/nitrite transporter family protein [Alphaproteobacteria bacterium]|nr:formate/nitrite transporter family protein [Alphaproteobacteria bacterium]
MSDRPTPNPLDAYAPAEIALRVEAMGTAKARLPALETLMLGALAGAFIAFGAMLYTFTVTGSPFGFGPTRLLGGAAFSLGLVLVVVAGAELFTGNALMVMAWVDRRIAGGELARNWLLVYVANFAGAAAMAWLIWLSGVMALGDGAPAATARAIAQAKLAQTPLEALIRGGLCNALVCLAVWLCLAAHDVASKVLAIVLPISAFVALGFEHSIANMYLVPLAWLLGAEGVAPGLFFVHLFWVTLGNIVGGGGGVALVYWVCYRRARSQGSSSA